MTDFDNKEPQGQQPQAPQPEPAPQPQEQPAQSAPVSEPQPPQPEAPAPQSNPYGQQVPHLTFDPNESVSYQDDPFQTPKPPQAPVPPSPEPEYQQTASYEAPPPYGGAQYGAPQYNGGQYQSPQYTQPPQQTYYQPQYNVPPAGYMQKSRMAAGLLGILLGSLGIHNFYLGFTTRAVVQLLVSLIGGVFTCGIATLAIAVWGFVEGVLLLTASPSRMYDGHGVILRD